MLCQGWYFDENCTERYSAPNVQVWGDMKLYAKWIELYNIYFIVNDTLYETIPNVIEIPNTLPTVEIEHYRFEGWYLYTDYVNKVVVGNKLIIDDVRCLGSAPS